MSMYIFRSIALYHSLTLNAKKGRIIRNLRAVAQLVARLVRDQEVPGSNPGCPKNLFFLSNMLIKQENFQ